MMLTTSLLGVGNKVGETLFDLFKPQWVEIPHQGAASMNDGSLTPFSDTAFSIGLPPV